jgi:hypothetical protein
MQTAAMQQAAISTSQYIETVYTHCHAGGNGRDEAQADGRLFGF